MRFAEREVGLVNVQAEFCGTELRTMTTSLFKLELLNLVTF